MDQKYGMNNDYDVICVGGGAASFYAAAHLFSNYRHVRILILEKGKDVLQKVRISGGGRCNVTNKETEPKRLASSYPRGGKQMIGPFSRHGPIETKKWFESHGVALKTESDGRVFPKSDQSSDIIRCLQNQTIQKGVKLHLQESMTDAQFIEQNYWSVTTNKGNYTCRFLFLGSGSSTRMWSWLSSIGINIIPPVPSIFTFNIKSQLLNELMGLSLPHVRLNLPNTPLQSEGPLLITHWGLSGPAVLRLSAWGARYFNEFNYKSELLLDLLPEQNQEQVFQFLKIFKEENSRKKVVNACPFSMPGRFWKSFVKFNGWDEEIMWNQCNKDQINKLAQSLKRTTLTILGKSTFKEEFVTAGGVDLGEVDMKEFNLKKLPNLYLAGEVLDIDGITGGFNFQAAWTGSWIAAQSILSKINP
jgi:predicted Rossmann fold flavoprotein